MVVIIIIAAVFSVIRSKAYVHTAQLNGYSLLSPLGKNRNAKKYFYHTALALAPVALYAILDSIYHLLSYINIVLFGLILLFFCLIKDYNPKKTLKYTNRTKRIFGLVAVITSAISAVALIKTEYAYIIICFILAILPLFVLIANALLYPFEKINLNRYVKRAEKVLKDNTELIKIGVTGSYGKTTVKNILAAMLSKSSPTVMTQANYNTPAGISLSVNNINSDTVYFIAEMGARRKGDIKKLCDIVKPDHAVITGIAAQHLKTFKSEQNILNEKLELLRAVRGGYVALGNCRELKNAKSDYAQIIQTGTENDGVYAQNVKIINGRTEFTLNLFGIKQKICCALIGKHNADNICVAAALAYKLGVSAEQIAEAVNEMEAVEHRLQIVRSDDITVIDDTYNANPEGVKAALDVLKVYNTRRILITPGIVELGRRERAENIKFGESVRGNADLVILIGDKPADYIFDGLLNSGFSGDKIFRYASLDDAKNDFGKIIKKGDIVMFINDLPDNY